MALSDIADAILGSRFSDDPAVMLVTISHPFIGITRLARNTDDVVSRGETYKAAWFEVDWVNDDGNIPRCTLSIPNVDTKEVGQRYLRQSIAPVVSLEVISLSDPDNPLGAVHGLDLRDIGLDPISVSGSLVGKDHSSEPLGTINVLPSNFPALFRRVRKE